MAALRPNMETHFDGKAHYRVDNIDDTDVTTMYTMTVHESSDVRHRAYYARFCFETRKYFTPLACGVVEVKPYTQTVTAKYDLSHIQKYCIGDVTEDVSQLSVTPGGLIMVIERHEFIYFLSVYSYTRRQTTDVHGAEFLVSYNTFQDIDPRARYVLSDLSYCRSTCILLGSDRGYHIGADKTYRITVDNECAWSIPQLYDNAAQCKIFKKTTKYYIDKIRRGESNTDAYPLRYLFQFVNAVQANSEYVVDTKEMVGKTLFCINVFVRVVCTKMMGVDKKDRKSTPIVGLLTLLYDPFKLYVLGTNNCLIDYVADMTELCAPGKRFVNTKLYANTLFNHSTKKEVTRLVVKFKNYTPCPTVLYNETTLRNAFDIEYINPQAQNTNTELKPRYLIEVDMAHTVKSLDHNLVKELVDEYLELCIRENHQFVRQLDSLIQFLWTSMEYHTLVVSACCRMHSLGVDHGAPVRLCEMYDISNFLSKLSAGLSDSICTQNPKLDDVFRTIAVALNLAFHGYSDVRAMMSMLVKYVLCILQTFSIFKEKPNQACNNFLMSMKNSVEHMQHYVNILRKVGNHKTAKEFELLMKNVPRHSKQSRTTKSITSDIDYLDHLRRHLRGINKRMMTTYEIVSSSVIQEMRYLNFNEFETSIIERLRYPYVSDETALRQLQEAYERQSQTLVNVIASNPLLNAITGGALGGLDQSKLIELLNKNSFRNGTQAAEQNEIDMLLHRLKNAESERDKFAKALVEKTVLAKNELTEIIRECDRIKESLPGELFTIFLNKTLSWFESRWSRGPLDDFEKNLLVRIAAQKKYLDDDDEAYNRLSTYTQPTPDEYVRLETLSEQKPIRDSRRTTFDAYTAKLRELDVPIDEYTGEDMAE